MTTTTTDTHTDTQTDGPRQARGATHARYEMILEAVEPIAHAEGTIGNASICMQRKIRQPDGTIIRVPIVTADAMRHQIREAGAYALLDAAGLLDGAGPQLTEAALRLLFNGGMLTGRGDASAVKLTEFRRMIETLPTLALLGGCANNHLVQGQLIIGDAMLLCIETQHFASPWAIEWLTACDTRLVSHREHIDEEQRVRFDPTRNKHTARLLDAGARDHVARELDASEAAHDDDNAVARERTKSTMMPRTAEVLAPGSLFFWSVEVIAYTELELDTFHTALTSFMARMRVGGKQGTGHGLLRAVVGNRVALARPSERAETMDMTALAPRIGELFRAHAKEHSAAIRAALSTVDA